MKRSGFTVVELVITITIMAILLTLGVIGLRSTQMNARDSERKGDVENIVTYFESFYTNPPKTSWSQSEASGVTGNSYPSTVNIATITSIRKLMPDLDPSALYAPGADIEGTMSLVAATSFIETEGGVQPQPTIDTYVYQPINKNGSPCSSATTDNPCRRFNIYYMLENDSTIYKVTSKNQ